MPSLDLGANAANLAGQILDQLKADVLGTLTDPEALAMAERATATLAAVPLAMIGAPEDARADLQNEYDVAMAVLYTLASAAVEDAAHAQQAVRERVYSVVNTVLRDAIAGAFVALKIAIV
jgi:hypothetical protein